MARKYHMSRVELYKKLADNTWDTTAIVLTDATSIDVKTAVGKVKDTFKFRVSNANDRLTRRLLNGDGSTTAFTIPYAAPTTFYSTSKLMVYVDDTLAVYNASPSTNLQYSISGSTITFGAAPGTGTENIEVRFEVISSDDKIAIYLWQDDTWDNMSAADRDTAFQIEGTITQPQLIANDKERTLAINGVGIIEQLFNALAFVKPTAQTKWHLVIQSVISQINKYNPTGKKIYGQDPDEWKNLGNPTKKSDNSDFPDLMYTASYKRGMEIIEEITADKYTEDGQYVYYVKRYSTNNYGFYVRYKDPDVATGNTITQGTEPTEIKAKRATDEVINAIIYNCGFDPYEAGMEYLNYNPASQSSLGSKWKYVTTTSHLGQTLLNIEFEADTSKWNTTSDGGRKENFPKDAEYTYTFQFEGRNTDGSYTGVAATAADDDAFRDAIRLEAKWRGKEVTDRIIKLYSNPRYKVTSVVYQSNTESIGAAYNIILPSFGLHTTHPLRLKEIKSTFWDTTLEFEEDETVAALA